MSPPPDGDTKAAPRPAEPIPPGDPRVDALRRLVGIVDRLRDPDGCPWDKKQTEASMATHLVEEAHELVEAIETGAADDVAEESGDVLMNVLLICRIANESGRFDLAAAAERIGDKLVRRHPHVFGDREASSADEALASWEAVKQTERQDAQRDASALAGVPKGLPALQRAARVCEKAVSSGFRWDTVAGAAAKVDEELGELREAVSDRTLGSDWRPEVAGAERKRVEHELGDLLLASAFFASYLGLDPEGLCRSAVRRFEGRFRSMESELGEGTLAKTSLSEMMAAWTRAKQT